MEIPTRREKWTGRRKTVGKKGLFYYNCVFNRNQ